MASGNRVWQGRGATREVKESVGTREVWDDTRLVRCRPLLQTFYVIYRFRGPCDTDLHLRKSI